MSTFLVFYIINLNFGTPKVVVLPTFKLKCSLLSGLVLAFWKHETESAREFSWLF